VGGDPDMTRAASINLAELLRQKGLEAEALAIYSDYATANPDDVLGRLNYAIALMDSGDVETAQEMFSDLLDRDDLSFRQWSQVGIGLYRAQSFELAAQAFERARVLNPFNKETLENLANTYYPVDPAEVLATSIDAGADRSTLTDDVAISPNTAVCSACHNSDLAAEHMMQNGGDFAASKDDSGAMISAGVETCGLCHGPGRTSDVKVKHGVGEFEFN